MRKTLQAVAAAAALIAGGSAQAAVVNTIDLFATAQFVEDKIKDGVAVTSQVAAAEAIGGNRELIVDKKSGASTNTGISLEVLTGSLSFSAPSSASAGTGIVRWDGAAMGGAIDAIGLQTAPGVGLFVGNVLTDFFQIDVISSDAGFVFDLEAYTDAANWSKVSIVSNEHLVPSTTYIPLAAFLACGFGVGDPNAIVTVTCGGGGVDFTNVGALQAVIDPNGDFAALDLSLGNVQVVPEPGALALVGLALAGAGLATRRRKV